MWENAKRAKLTIVSKDADFQDMVIIQGFPPKVIWLRFGNATTKEVIARLRGYRSAIDQFLLDDRMGVLELRQM